MSNQNDWRPWVDIQVIYERRRMGSTKRQQSVELSFLISSLIHKSYGSLLESSQYNQSIYICVYTPKTKWNLQACADSFHMDSRDRSGKLGLSKETLMTDALLWWNWMINGWTHSSRNTPFCWGWCLHAAWWAVSWMATGHTVLVAAAAVVLPSNIIH